MRLWATSRHPAGFTLIEVLVSVGILALFFGLSFASLSAMHKTSIVRGSGDTVASAVSTAALKARSGAYGTPWGVYFDYDNVTRIPVKVVVFSGSTYASRNTAYDIEYPLGVLPVFTTVSLQGAGVSGGSDHELVFAALTGTTSQYGSIVLTAHDKVSTITISSIGVPTRQ
jgi:prepilin-type N-terminal cleavage/methylation domain-containing protein